LRETELAAAPGNLVGDRGEQPAILADVRQPLSEPLDRLPGPLLDRLPPRYRKLDI